MCYKLFVVLIFLSEYIIRYVYSIKCYQCFLAEQPYYLGDVIVKTCKDFDYSNDYIVDCPESTFCYKKSVRDYFYKTEYVREERGCAQQLYRGQKYNFNLGWISDTYVVGNAYQRGCKMEENYGLKTSNVKECYCDNGDLCNSGVKNRCFGLPLGFVFVILPFFIK